MLRPLAAITRLCLVAALTIQLAQAAPAPSYGGMMALMVQPQGTDYNMRTRLLLGEIKSRREFLMGRTDENGKPVGNGGFLKTVGYFQTKSREDPKTIQNPYDAGNSVVKSNYEAAQRMAKTVRELVQDKSLPARERFAVLRAFLRDIILPLRELTQLLGPRAPEFADRSFFESLVPPIPAEMLEQDPNLDRVRATQLLEAIGFDPKACEEAPGQEGSITLRMDPQFFLGQDALAVAHAPTPENYAHSLKLTTLSLLIAQIQHHRQLLGDSKPIQVPQACRSRLDGDLPATIDVAALSPEDRQARFDALMESNGLSALSPEYQHAFETMDLGDPNNKGFVGYTPFDRLQAAELALKQLAELGNSPDGRQPVEPAIDDRDAYSHLVGLRGGAVISRLGKGYTTGSGDPDPARVQQQAQSLLQLQDDVRTLGPVPAALVERMDKKEASDWREVVPAPLRKKLESTQVTIPFPPATSPAGNRNWAVRELARSIEEDILPAINRFQGRSPGDVMLALYKDPELERKMRFLGAACGASTDTPVYGMTCPGLPSGKNRIWDYYQSLSNKIRQYRLPERSDGDRMGPLSREEREFFDQTLARTWNTLSNLGELKASRISEWDLLGSQIGNNPFAGVRLAFQIKIEDEGPRSARGKALAKAMAEMGLDDPATPFLANRTLGMNQKRDFWISVRDEHDEMNSNLFKGRALGVNSGVRYYDVLSDLASSRVLSRQEAEAASQKNRLPPERSQDYASHLGQVFESDLGRKGELLQAIYRAKGDPARQERLFEQYAREYQLADPSEAGSEARKSLLELDTQLKKPLFESVIVKASAKRHAELMAALSDLCNLKPTDHQKFKQLVLSTLKAQDSLNQQLGLRGLPREVQEELDRMSDKDWKELKMSGLALGLFIGATLLLTVSTGGMGLALTPALASGAAAMSGAMAIGSISVGAVAIPKMWLEELPSAEERLRYAETFEDLRLTNEQSVERLRGEVSTMKTWGIGGNILFALPMIKPAAVALQASGRATSTLIKASRPGISAAQRRALTESAKRAQFDSEAITAEYVFGYRKLTTELLNPRALAAKVIEETAKPVQLAVRDPEQIIRDSAKLYAAHFKNDPKVLDGFLSSLQQKIAKSAARDPHWGPNFWRRRILDRKEMTAMAEELREALKHDDLVTVLTRKNDLFSELVERMPRGKRDWLGMFTIEGIPGVNTPLMHLKELQQSRGALLRQLGRQSPAKASAVTTRALVGGFRETLLSRGAEGEARWLKIRSELQGTLKLAKPEMVEVLVRRGAELPEEALKGPEIRRLLVETETQLRDYKSIAEFDQWLSVKRLVKLSGAGGSS